MGCSSEVEGRGGQGEAMRVEVGREELARGESSQPVQPPLQPDPQDLHPLTTLFSPHGPALLSLFARDGLIIFGVASFHSVRVSSGLWELCRPSSLLFPRFRIAVSLGIEKRGEVSSNFSSEVAMAKPGQDKNECLPTYYIPGTVDTSSHDL